MNNKLTFLPSFLLTAALLTLSGCLPGGGPSAPPHFYRLEYSAEPSKVTDAETVKSPSKILVKVTAVSALRGVKIVLANSPYELNYEEFERWAEPLSQGVQRLLVDGLKTSFTTVQAVPVAGGYKPDYRIAVTLEKLWGTRHGEIILNASWIVTDSSENVVATGQQEFRKNGWNTGDYRQLAERISNTVPALTQAIEQTLSSLEAAKKK